MISTDINKAVALLKEGNLVGLPTETVYGLAGNACQEEVVRKIFELKGRPLYNPLIVHIPDSSELDRVAISIPETARILADHFWPGPLTLVLEKHSAIPLVTTAGSSRVAVRVPQHPMALEVLGKTGFPLAAPSANPFGSISPTTAQHVHDYFGEKLPVVLDGGPCTKGLESTILGFEQNEIILYRHGAISLENIEALTGRVRVQNRKARNPDAPGMLLKHYAPKAKLIRVESIKEYLDQHSGQTFGVLSLRTCYDNKNIVRQISLSESGDLSEAASGLYAALHKLDKSGAEIILAEYFPDTGLGKTINDRLERASKA